MKKKNLLLRLWKYMTHAKWLLIGALILNILCNLLALTGPKLSGMAINAIEPGAGKVVFNKVFFYAGLMIGFYIMSSAMSYILALVMRKISQSTARKLRSDIFAKLSKLPVGYFDTHQAGDVISRITYDVDTVHTCLSSDILQIFTSIVTVVVSFTMMITISPRLVLVFVVTVPLTIIVTRFLAVRLRPLFRKRSGKLGEMNGFVEEYTSGLRTIRAYHQEDETVRRFDVKNDEAVTTYYNADYQGSVGGPTVNFINNVSLALVSIFGALLYMGGGINLGDVSAFVLYSRKFSGPINETANIITELQSAFAAAERVFKLLDEDIELPDAPGAAVAMCAPDSIAFQNVGFGYEAERKVLRDFNLEVKRGDVVAIVGHTGAGKTTIINLLMRFYDATEGRILLDGTNICDITRNSLRSLYTMVLQDTWLFYGTVFDNIAYGAGTGVSVTREQVESAARAAKIHDYIMSMPEGYDTMLSDNASNISKGQKQLITIARAMLAPGEILILDEATSNVDIKTEYAIRDAMDTLMRDKTCFVIAHRLSTIQNADVIVLVDDGKIMELGSHQQLLAKGGMYAELYNAR